LRLLGIDTKTDHCAHNEEIKDAKAWDGDVVELQLAHLDNSTVEGLLQEARTARADRLAHEADAALG
jgi:hypothetical protein